MTEPYDLKPAVPHKPRPTPEPGKPFAYFQWNYGWGVWEEVSKKYARSIGVVSAHALPDGMKWTKEFTALLAAVEAYGMADEAAFALPHYQGCALEEPMRSALDRRKDAVWELARAAVRFRRSQRPRRARP